MSQSQVRRRFTSEFKAQIVRRHLADKAPVSALCDEHKIQAGQVHDWVATVLAQAHKAFEKGPDHQAEQRAKDRKIEQLEAKVVSKNEVIAELLEENIQAKKSLGEP